MHLESWVTYNSTGIEIKRTHYYYYYSYTVIQGGSTGTVLDLASTATVYSSYLSAALAARVSRAAVAVDGCTAVL